jgi:pimeloyl-ACP methyl ester carboxylesterase
MARDGIEVATYITRHLHKEKVILLGGSWGSVLAVHMVKARPDLFHAYIGTGQVVESVENQAATYAKVMTLARAAADIKTLATLESLGAPPWTNPRNLGVLRRITRLYEKQAADPAPSFWWVPALQYATPQEQADYETGEEFSYLQFVGVNGNGMFSKVDLWKLGSAFDVPVFLLHGAEDLVSAPEVAKRYYDSLSAPEKAFVLLPQTGHDPNERMIDAEYNVLRARVVPRLR